MSCGWVARSTLKVMTTKNISKRDFSFFLTTMCVVGSFYWLYLAQYIPADFNGEALDTPLTVAYLQLTNKEAANALLGNAKEQRTILSLPNYGVSRLDYFARVFPLFNTLYAPFISKLGMSNKAVACYSLFFSALAVLGTGLLAYLMYGRWQAVLAAFFLFTNLCWLIHVRVGYAAWMPSVNLMIWLVICLHQYARKKEVAYLVFSGMLLGLAYLTGWIVFVFVVMVLGLALMRPLCSFVHNTFTTLICGITFALIFTFAYSCYIGCGWADPHVMIWNTMFTRATTGEAGVMQYSVLGKMVYTFKCLFLDMRTFDPHADKFLEGYPAIPLVTTVFLLAGILYTCRDILLGHRPGWLLLLWIASVWGVIGTMFVYGHRYALLAFPAVAILAAKGVVDSYRGLSGGWRKVFLAVVVVSLGYTLLAVHRDYYTTYLHLKTPDVETDYIRGHTATYDWLKKHYSSDDTLVVLDDPRTLHTIPFVFHTFDQPYRFVYWSNYFNATSLNLNEWEGEVLKKYHHIVYIFSSSTSNVWEPNLRSAHLTLAPSFFFQHGAAYPAIYAFVVSSNQEIRLHPCWRTATQLEWLQKRDNFGGF